MTVGRAADGGARHHGSAGTTRGLCDAEAVWSLPTTGLGHRIRLVSVALMVSTVQPAFRIRELEGMAERCALETPIRSDRVWFRRSDIALWTGGTGSKSSNRGSSRLCRGGSRSLTLSESTAETAPRAGKHTNGSLAMDEYQSLNHLQSGSE